MEHFLVELFLRGTLLCLLTAAVLLLLRRAAAAAYRHLLCVLALCGLLALPLAQRLLPPLPVLQPQSPVTPNRGTLPTEAADRPAGGRSILEMPSLPETPQHRRVFRTDPTAFLPQESAPTTPLLAPVERVSRPKHVRTATAALLCVIWGLGAATLLLRLSVALLRLRRLEAESRKAMLGNVPIRVGERIATPLTWGIRRQVILLPAALLSGDPAVCETALRHEQAHIDRGDWLWNLLAELVCALCWFQPGVWWLRRRMRLESERACDDRVLLSGIDGPDYAAHLLQILKSARTGERASASELASAMAHSGSMEARMRHILDTATPRCAQTKWLAVSASLALALLSCTALRLSARPADAKTPVDPDATILKSRRSILPSRPSHSPLPNADSGMPYTANLPLPVLTPDVTLPIVSPQQTFLPNSPPATD
jgi:beta-lactamase regulating signal transducer with metallopeptidase domain